MFSYNNIVEKGEPKEISPIENCLDDLSGSSSFSQTKVEKVDCIVVENFLSDEECDALVAACESVGYSYWQQTDHYDTEGEKKADAQSKAVRVVDTIEAKFPKLSQRLSERVKSVVKLEPKKFFPDMENAEELFERDIIGEWVPHALAENLLLGRYHPGGHFMPHIDGSTIIDLNTRSMYTLLVYLSDVEEGGETFILDGDQSKVTVLESESASLRGTKESRVGAVKPKKGRAAFFYHSLLHEASPVVKGVKYICRGDLLYQRTPPILTAPEDLEAFQLYERARQEESRGNSSAACQLFRRVRMVSQGVAQLYQID